MAILVTGGAGYIGSVVVDDLIETGEHVVVLDDLSRGHRDAVSENATFFRGDISDSQLVKRITKDFGISAAMHFSAFADVAESVAKPAIYYHNNFIKTVAFLDALVNANIKRVVFSSTCAIFGEPQYLPLNERHPQNPSSPYGRTKLMVEGLLRDYEQAYDLKHVALRYFNACGATTKRFERHDPETHLIPLVLDVAAGIRESIAIFGTDYPTPDGTAIRDYIHISDLSEAHILAANFLAREGSSQRINLGNGEGFSVREVIACAEKVTEKKIAVREESRREGDPSKLIADATRAKEVLGWDPKVRSLEKIIESVWRWYGIPQRSDPVFEYEAVPTF